MASPLYWAIHGIGFAIAWAFLLIVLIGSVRWFSPYWFKNGIKIHAITGTLIMGLTLGFGIHAKHVQGTVLFNKHVIHAMTGHIFILILGPLSLTGVVYWYIKQQSKQSGRVITFVKYLHNILGWLFVAASFVEMVSGFRRFHLYYGQPDLSTVYLPIQLVLFLALEGWFRKKRATKVKFTAKGRIKMKEEEFEERIKRGEKLCILDDLVLDISGYDTNHPGGAFLIRSVVGRDISKFFYGGYALDSKGNDRYNHSNVAKEIVNRLAVAVLVQRRASLLGWIDHKKTFKLNKDTSVFTFRLFAKSTFMTSSATIKRK